MRSAWRWKIGLTVSSKSLNRKISREEQERRSKNRRIDFLLRGIIKANTHHDSTVTDDARLSRAREALLGEKPRTGRTEMDDDFVLFHILREVEKDGLESLMKAVLSHPKKHKLNGVRNFLENGIALARLLQSM